MKFFSVLVQRIVLAGLFLFGWYLVSARVPAFVLPGPDAVFRAFLSLLSSSTFWKDVLDTARRVISGFVLAAVVGSVLGVVFGSSKALATFFAPVISVLNSVSSAIWAIFAIIWFGISDASTITVVFMASMPIIFTNVWEGTKSVDRQYIELAKSFRMNWFQIARKIYVPTILPAFFSAARLAFGFGWRVSLVAETIGAGSGIGYRLRIAADMIQSAEVFAWAFLMVIFMLVIESGVIRPMEKWLFRWRPAS